MTAIAIAYTRRGFSIAADGRACAKDVPKILADDIQKIFHVKCKYGNLAFGVMGVIKHGEDFNALEEVQKFLSLPVTLRTRNLYDLAENLGAHMKAVFDNAFKDGRYSKYYESESGRIFRIWIIAFFKKKQPSWAEISFRHINQVLQEPELKFENTPPGFRKAGGCGDLGDAVFNDQDPRFAKYFIKFDRDTPNATLDDGTKWVRAYVEVHKDPLAIKLYPKCAESGGHTHIAALTDQEFRWIIPPVASCDKH